VKTTASAAAQLDAKSYWLESSHAPRFAQVDQDVTVDVAVVGAGITGLTAAYLLKRAGRTVAVINRARVGGVDSTLTTAHVTCVTDRDLSTLVRELGRDHAQAVDRRGVHLGLPVPRVAVQADGRRALRTGGIAAQQGRGVIALLSSDHSAATPRHPRAITSLDAAEPRARRLQAVPRRHSTRGYTRCQEA